jgi:hypothetical protein
MGRHLHDNCLLMKGGSASDHPMQPCIVETVTPVSEVHVSEVHVYVTLAGIYGSAVVGTSVGTALSRNLRSRSILEAAAHFRL